MEGSGTFSSASIASHGMHGHSFLKSKTGEAVEKGLSSIFSSAQHQNSSGLIRYREPKEISQPLKQLLTLNVCLQGTEYYNGRLKAPTGQD